VVLAGQLTGAHPIIAVDVQPHKLQLARELGATDVFDARDDTLEEKLREVVGSAGADVVVEATGRLDVMDLAYRIASAHGRTILVGVQHHGDRLPIDTMPLHFGKRLTGSHGGDARPDVDIPRLIRLQQAGRFDLAPLVSHTFPLDQVNEAIALMRQGDAVRCVLRMDQ
jgi:S-(hydroxymethyl)glutathione dehydrogenase/alcohol dehydrogenase